MLQGNSVELGVIALIGAVLAGSLGSTFSRRIFPLNQIVGSLLEGAFLKVVVSVIVVVLGLSAWILTPIMPLLVLIGAVRLLPVKGRARTGLLLIGCLSIGLGAALSTADLPSSHIAALKLMGSLFQVTIYGMLWP
jgi:predicted cation transporter